MVKREDVEICGDMWRRVEIAHLAGDEGRPVSKVTLEHPPLVILPLAHLESGQRQMPKANAKGGVWGHMAGVCELQAG